MITALLFTRVTKHFVPSVCHWRRLQDDKETMYAQNPEGGGVYVCWETVRKHGSDKKQVLTGFLVGIEKQKLVLC